LRHRSAIGMSESTDTLVMAVSEENGKVDPCAQWKILTRSEVETGRAKDIGVSAL